MTPSQSCRERLVGRSGLEELGIPTQKTVADATDFAAKDFSSHCYRAGPDTMVESKDRRDAWTSGMLRTSSGWNEPNRFSHPQRLRKSLIGR